MEPPQAASSRKRSLEEEAGAADGAEAGPSPQKRPRVVETAEEDQEPPGPSEELQEAGAATLELLKPGSNITVSDVQDLVLHTLLDMPAPTWVKLHKARPEELTGILDTLAEALPPAAQNNAEVSRVVVVMLCGLDWSLFEEQRAVLPCLRDCFSPPMRVYGEGANTPTAKVVMNFMMCKQRTAAKEGAKGDPTKRRSTAVVPRIDKDRPMPFPPAYYQLTPAEMADNNYPLPAVDAESGQLRCPPGYVITQPSGQGIARSPPIEMLALDCEMCYTAAGLEVTRCSVVDASCAVVYDQLILPSTPILDYNTQHSGITAEQMSGVSTTLADVQADLLELVAEETLLVGHSLDNDLVALKLVHRAAVDTSLLYPHPRGPPFKPALRVLTERLLGRRIQEGSHDSVADAAATMALARLKFSKGPAFGEARSEGRPLAEVLSEASPPRRVALLDRPKALSKLATGAASAIQAGSDCEAGAKGAREARKGLAQGGAHLLWAHLSDLGALQEARAQRARRRAEVGDAGEGEGEAAAEAERQREVLAGADAAVAQLLEAAQPGTLLLVVTGQGDAAAVRRLMEAKFRRKAGLSGGPWDDSDDAALATASTRAQNGLLFFTIK